MDYLTHVVRSLNGVYKKMLGNSGVDLIDGYAKVTQCSSGVVDGRARARPRCRAVVVPG